MKEIISVIGLGYVGLPVAFSFAKKYRTIGFDVSVRRIDELKKGYDRTGELDAADLASTTISYSTDPDCLTEATFHIVTVPTPIDQAKRPDLRALLSASELLGRRLKVGDIVVYESTVYPGLTQEVCVPVLERHSGLKCGPDFKVGYSPERINPGDPTKGFEDIVKVVSGMDDVALNRVAAAYESVVTAGIHRAPSIAVAEAAKVIENTQRDLNVALVNELSMLFHSMGIDTLDVLDAAATKWNFLNFRPGLVGGHCIGVDPYYLTHKAEELGYLPQVILAGRRLNDSVGRFVAQSCVKAMAGKGIPIGGSVLTVMGVTFKENCPDTRNSKVFDIIDELKSFGVEIQVTDAHAHPDDVRDEHGIELQSISDIKPAHAIILAVAHNEYRKVGFGNLKELLLPNGVVFDLKGICDREEAKRLNVDIWRL